MTIYRFKFIIAAAIALWSSLGNAAEWSSKIDRVATHQVQWLMYGETETEAELALYCQLSSGWVYVLTDRSADRILDPALLAAGTVEIRPSYRVTYSEIFGNHAMTAVIDSENQLWPQVVATGAVAVDGLSYPLDAQNDRIALVEFLRRCSGTEADQ